MECFDVGNKVGIRDYDCSKVVNDLNGIEYTPVNECWGDFGFLPFGTDIECIQTSETVFVHCCGGRMGNASVANLGFGGAVLDAILVDRMLRRADLGLLRDEL